MTVSSSTTLSDLTAKTDPLKELAPESQEMYQMLCQETDRGLVIVASAYLEDALEELLRAKLELECQTPKPNEKTKLLNTLLKSPESPILNFSIRTKLAWALGLIDEKQKNVLDKFRELRNKFAHLRAPKEVTVAHVKPMIEKCGEDEIESVSRWWIERDPNSVRIPGPRHKLMIITVILDSSMRRRKSSVTSQDGPDP